MEDWIDVSKEKDGTVLKQIVKAAPSDEDGNPKKGDRVKVHYVGRLTDGGVQFDSSRSRDKPFEFTLGSGVIEGWSQAVPTMLIGEKSNFRLAPSMGYGAEGQSPSIPGEAWLDFEIELLGFTDREDISGGAETIMKKVITKGDGWQKPGHDSDLEFEVEFDQIIHKSWWPSAQRLDPFTIDDTIMIPAEIRLALESMTKHESANIRLGKHKSEYQYYTVKVVSWIDNEQCITNEHGAVIKRTLIASPTAEIDWQTPADLDTVRVKGQVYTQDNPNHPLVDFGALDDDDDDDQGGVEWILDSGEASVLFGDRTYPLCDGIDAGLKKMKKKEIALLTISSKYGFKQSGPAAADTITNTNHLENPTKNHASTLLEQPLQARLKLCAIQSQALNLTGIDRIAAINKKRELGNIAFSKGDYVRAARRYDAAIQQGSSEYDINENDLPALRAAMSTTRCNRAACSLKLGDFTHAITIATHVLEQDASHTKALFRRAKAYSAIQDWTKAKADLKTLLKIDENNTDAKRALAQVHKVEKAYKDKQKRLYAGRCLFD